jgi:hypothetical protein
MHTPPPAPLSPAPALTLTLTLALSLSLSLSLAPTAAVAQDAAAMPQMAPASFTPHHAVSVSILGLYAMAGTNVAPYALTYEWIIDDHWGLVVEGRYFHFHHHPIHVNVFGGAIGLRYHVLGLRSSPFVGVLGGYHYGIGRTHDESHQDTEIRTEQPFVTAHVGYRWVLPSGLNFAVRLGAGWGEHRVASSPGVAAPTNDALAQARDAIGFGPVAIDGELAAGYSF